MNETVKSTLGSVAGATLCMDSDEGRYWSRL